MKEKIKLFINFYHTKKKIGYQNILYLGTKNIIKEDEISLFAPGSINLGFSIKIRNKYFNLVMDNDFVIRYEE